jgi:hypothetical protein
MELPFAARTKIALPAFGGRDLYTWVPNHDGVLLCLTLDRHWEALNAPAGGSNLDAHRDHEVTADAHAVEFSKTAKPLQKGFLQRRPIRPSAQGRLRADPGV